MELDKSIKFTRSGNVWTIAHSNAFTNDLWAWDDGVGEGQHVPMTQADKKNVIALLHKIGVPLHCIRSSLVRRNRSKHDKLRYFVYISFDDYADEASFITHIANRR